MTAEALNERIQTLFEGEYTAQVYFILRKNEKFEMKRADIEDKTEPEIREMFSGYVREITIENSDLRICDLSSADEHPKALYRYDYETHPEELGLFKDFNIQTAVKSEMFNFKDDDLSDLYGYIIYLGSMDDGIALFKKHYSISLIKRSSFLLGMAKDSERFEKIPGNDIIRLNRTAHMILLDGQIYVIDIKMLEQNMGFTELITKSANESLDEIEQLKIVEDMEVLRESVEDLTFARKLAKIKKSSPVILLKIDAATILAFTKETTALSSKFKYNEDGSQFRLSTKKSRNDFLALMNDSFLTSELTKRYYEASAKDGL